MPLLPSKASDSDNRIAEDSSVGTATAAAESRRLGGKAEYVFSDLTPGPYGRWTHHVSKAYGRFRQQAGVSERGEDFHALRHTFTETLEGKGVPLSTIQLEYP